jgi:2-phosphosulfolactate phosphatase
MTGSVIIDCFPESAGRYRQDHAIVVVDVIRATTTATTALSRGRRVFPCQTTDEAFVLASRLQDPLLVGELGGNMPYGFDLNNSPALIAERSDAHRPIIMVSSSGTQLLLNAEGAEAVYILCLRNLSAVADYVFGRHQRIAVLGAGTRGRFRREDQIACSWLAEKLLDCGCTAEDSGTLKCVKRWRGADADVIRYGRSADYLRKSKQERDLEFILTHLDDLEIVPTLAGSELVPMMNSALHAVLNKKAG